MLATSLSLLSVAFMAAQASAHMYISHVRVNGGDWQKGQKSGASGSFRESSDNTGWVGSQFLEGNNAIACGASNTPFKQVAAPGGIFFSSGDQSAQQTLDVPAGGVVTIVASGNPGQGFPHPKGHVQVWLARCGSGHDDCKGFDATNGDFFKIVGEKDGIPNTLRKQMNYDLDGQTYDINIPKEVQDGSYILRYELIAFGQSSGQEGGQDQYYPSCGQISISDGLPSQPAYKTVKFPGGYKNGNIDEGSLPGPAVLELAEGAPAPTPGDDDEGDDQPGETVPAPSGGNCGTTTTPSAVPECASMCFGVKITEHAHLAPSCGASDVACMCEASKFHSAFENCASDHCGSDLSTGLAAFDFLCKIGAKMTRRAMKRNALARRSGHQLSTLLSREL